MGKLIDGVGTISAIIDVAMFAPATALFDMAGVLKITDLQNMKPIDDFLKTPHLSLGRPSACAACVLVVSALLASPAMATDVRSSNSSFQELQKDATEKYNAYAEAFNAVNEMFYGSTKGMSDLLEKYKAQNLAKRSSGRGSEPVRYMNTSMLRNSVDALRTGLKIADVGSYAKVDGIAKAMIVNAESLLKLSREMEDYLVSKKYLDDNFARGREIDGPYIAGWTQFIDDHTRFGEELEVALRADRLESIKYYRNDHQDLRAASIEVMVYSSDLIDLFDEPAEFRDKEKVAKADVLAARLEKSIAEIRERSASDRENARQYNNLADHLNDFLGRYRSLRSSLFPSQKEVDAWVERYNRAVSQSDRLP